MRVVLIGHRGQLGSDLKKEFVGEDLILLNKEDIPVEDGERVNDAVRRERPDMILNCAAFHRVDDCEEQVPLSFAVNVFGVRHLALAARESGATLVHFSTDYVYDSERRSPYREHDVVCPKSVYGVSKAAGETMLQSIWPNHFIFRLCGLYGYSGSREKGTNFVEMMLGLARQGKPIRVVHDQVLTPTSTVDVAAMVRRVTATRNFGLYHLTNAGECSWHEFARSIFDFASLETDLTAVSSDAFPTRAQRPRYSVLDNHRLRSEGFGDMPEWRDALRRYIEGRAAAGRT